MVQTFPNFSAWVASFSGNDFEKEQDDILVKEFKKRENCPPSAETPFLPIDESPIHVRLIIADLKLRGSPAVEQLYVHSNTPIEEVLRELKDRGISLDQWLMTGYSSVTGLRAEGMRRYAMIGPLVALSTPVPVRITHGKSCYDIAKGLAINEDEELLAYYNRLIFQRMPPNSELGINYRLDGIDVRDTLTGHEFVIRLCRTLRVPENGTVHDIPATFGPLPHIDISKCATDDIPEMKKK
jgi:hypothetical protein